MWLEVTPKKLFSALGGAVMAASSGRQKAQSQSFATLGLVQVAPQGIADQGRNGKLFSLGQKAQLTIRGFFKKKGRSFHMTYDAIHASRRSTEAMLVWYRRIPQGAQRSRQVILKVYA